MRETTKTRGDYEGDDKNRWETMRETTKTWGDDEGDDKTERRR